MSFDYCRRNIEKKMGKNLQSEVSSVQQVQKNAKLVFILKIKLYPILHFSIVLYCIREGKKFTLIVFINFFFIISIMIMKL